LTGRDRVADGHIRPDGLECEAHAIGTHSDDRSVCDPAGEHNLPGSGRPHGLTAFRPQIHPTVSWQPGLGARGEGADDDHRGDWRQGRREDHGIHPTADR
jgi:hypothetical protein